ncbi:MoxR family ATPase [Candidatus Woesearchaeota archaeon]|nr:MoxR family ATPase [Candidatus Woesearchaeota archaeon]
MADVEEQIKQISKQGSKQTEPEPEHEPRSTAATVRADETQDAVDRIVNSVKDQAQEPTDQLQKFLLSKTYANRLKAYVKVFADVRKEIAKLVVGQDEIVTALLRALVSDGHVLIEGVPGIAKTTLIRALSKTLDCSFARIQFTPDLLPSDIIGISTYQEGRGFYTLKGPIFNNFILADEINRAPPKVQSALLESMAEKQATIAKETFPVPLPFFTMATQNPLESMGTYTLPEAQIDRFLFKLYMGYPNIEDEQLILRSNINEQLFDTYEIKPILNPETLLDIQADSKKIYVAKKVEKYIVRIVDATRNPKKYGVSLGKYIDYGGSPRASIGIFKAARSDAMIHGQNFVTPHHVKAVTKDVLRHRLLMSYEGQAENIKSEDIIDEILKKVPVP